MKSWFVIDRSLFENELWLEKPFDRVHAWIDLIGSANYQDGSFLLRGIKVQIKRGQIAWSSRFMAKRWGWSVNKVTRFLRYLKTNTQVNTQETYPISLITIINYDKFQSRNEKTNTQTNTQTNTTLNNVNKEITKEEEEFIFSRPLKERGELNFLFKKKLLKLENGKLLNLIRTL